MLGDCNFVNEGEMGVEQGKYGIKYGQKPFFCDFRWRCVFWVYTSYYSSTLRTIGTGYGNHTPQCSNENCDYHQGFPFRI